VSQLVAIHFWDAGANSAFGEKSYFDVEAFASDTPAATIVSWLTEREAAKARGVVRIDWAWGTSVPKSAGDRATYSQRVLTIAQAVESAGLATRHYVLGNETNLPQEGGASPQEVADAYVAVYQAIGQASWSRKPKLLPSPPSTGVEYVEYLKSTLTAIQAQGVTPDAIALHSYEDPANGSGNDFFWQLNQQATVVKDVGLSGRPIFVTETNLNMGIGGDDKGATFVNNLYPRLDAWNQGQEGNPDPGALKTVCAAWFVWHDDGNWAAYSIPSHPATLAAFKNAALAGHASGVAQ
jgi:hypothetical protein